MVIGVFHVFFSCLTDFQLSFQQVHGDLPSVSAGAIQLQPACRIVEMDKAI